VHEINETHDNVGNVHLMFTSTYDDKSLLEERDIDDVEEYVRERINPIYTPATIVKEDKSISVYITYEIETEDGIADGIVLYMILEKSEEE
jgi:hypothetical protein